MKRILAIIACIMVLVASLPGAMFATAQSSAGRIAGTVAFVSANGTFSGVVPGATIQVAVEDLHGEFTADNLGDFSKRVPPGTYTITGVVGCEGQKLTLF